MEKMLKSAQESRDEYSRKYYDKVNDQKIDKMMLRRMSLQLKKLDPTFDYLTLEKDCMKTLGIDYAKDYL